MSGLSVALPEDLPRLMALEHSFPDAQRWSEDSWRGELMAGNRYVVVSREDDEIEAAATYCLSGDVVDLYRIVTHPAARRTGLARQLMAAGLEWAARSGATRMMLEVEATNGAALALYSGQGFHRIAERPHYYGAGAHAVILERAIRDGDAS